MASSNVGKQGYSGEGDKEAFRLLVEQIPAVTYIVELGEPSRFIYISPQVKQLTGYPQERWLADPELWRRQIYEEDRTRVREEVARRNAAKEPYAIDHRIVTREGHVRWVRNEASTLAQHTVGQPARVYGVVTDVTDRKLAEEGSRRMAHDFEERVKELSCLYGISSLTESRDLSLDEILQGLVELIPPSWECPDITCARLIFEEREYVTSGFRETPWRMDLPVESHGREEGRITVCSLEERPLVDGSPFAPEEHLLLRVLTGRVARIVERMRAEEELGRVQRRFADLVNNLNVGIYRNTPGEGGRFLEANPKLVEMFEAESKEKFLTHSVSDLYRHPEERRAFSEKMLRDGFVRGEELELVTLKGRPFWAAVTAIRKESEDGSIFFDGIVEDIDDGKRANQQLMLQSAALSSAANAIVITDFDGSIRWVNPAFSVLTGYSKDEAIGANPRILKSGMQHDEFYEVMWTTILAGEVWRGELVNRRKDGSTYTEFMTITPVTDDAGEILNFIAI